MQGIKLLKNTDFIRFKIAAEGTRESWGISYYLPSNSGIQIMHIIEECLPSAKAIILNNSGSFVNVEYAPHYV